MAFYAASGGSDAGLSAFDAWSAKREDIYDGETTARAVETLAYKPADKAHHRQTRVPRPPG